MSANNTAGSQLCPGCRKLINRSVDRCPYCQLKHPGSRLKNIFLAVSASSTDRLVTALITINVIMFILSIAIQPRLAGFNPFEFLAPTNKSLLILGSTGTLPLFHLQRWWTLVSAGFLHGGLLHLVFNMLALRQLAPLMIQEFGTNRTIILYTLGGAGGFLISSLAGVSFTIGASAAICSLIGALLYYGRNRGGVYGRNVFNQIGGWAVGIALFGFLVPGINNWGHGGGMAVGALLAYLLGYREKKQETFSHRVMAMGCIIGTCLILTWSCLNGMLFLFFGN
ncbi:MAG: rhomboid family intramembrane serine protease [Proteobacteria bacterium]|nr:rhomboid family intramembrane serine protease [Pseudomonadota bacterium]